MKILHVISGNDTGGGANHVLNICSAPIEKYSSSICCVGLGGLLKIAKSKNVETVSLSIKEILMGKLLNYINENSIDLVNFHGAKSNFIYYLLRTKIKIPCVVTVHSDYRYDFINNKIKHILFTILSELGLRKYRYYICASKYIKETLQDNGFKGDKYIVYNGIDCEDVRIDKSREQIRDTLKIKESDFVYTMVARMHPIKNHIKLIEAFYKLITEVDDVILLLLGEGEEEKKLKAVTNQLKVENRVIFLGFKSNKMDYINASEITILTSLNEGGSPPIVILESAIAKKTIISSNVGDIADIINETNGYLIDPNNTEDIYSKMKKAYLEKEILKFKGEKLYEDITYDYSIEKFWERYYKSYKNILSKENGKVEIKYESE